MGVASMSFTCSMPSASMERTCSGSFFPRISDSSPGIRLSRISVVLPEPDTPVTTVSFPFGISTSRGFTVWISDVESRIFPSLNIPDKEACSRRWVSAEPERKGPIMEPGFPDREAGVPSAMTRPPSAPAPGPISMIQSETERTCVS